MLESMEMNMGHEWDLETIGRLEQQKSEMSDVSSSESSQEIEADYSLGSDSWVTVDPYILDQGILLPLPSSPHSQAISNSSSFITPFTSQIEPLHLHHRPFVLERAQSKSKSNGQNTEFEIWPWKIKEALSKKYNICIAKIKIWAWAVEKVN